MNETLIDEKQTDEQQVIRPATYETVESANAEVDRLRGELVETVAYLDAIIAANAEPGIMPLMQAINRARKWRAG